MNPSLHPEVSKRQRPHSGSPGVYTDLDSLVRLQFKARGFSYLPRQPIHSVLAGRHASRLRGRGLNFEEIRRYQPGDDIRNMDWRVTARLQKPHVRVYTEERDRPVLLLIDQRQCMFFGSQRTMKSVVAAEMAALSAWRVLAAGDRVGAIVFNDTEIVEIGPHRSRERVMHILQEVVRLNHSLAASSEPNDQPGMYNRVLERAARLASHDFLVTSISDSSGLDEKTVEWVTRLTEHNDMLGIFIHDPLEADLPDVGPLVAEGDGGQLVVDSGSPAIRGKFARSFSDRKARLEELSRRRAIPILPIRTDEDPALQLRRLLGVVPQGK